MENKFTHHISLVNYFYCCIQALLQTLIIDDHKDYVIKLTAKRSLIGIVIMLLYLKTDRQSLAPIVCKKGAGLCEGKDTGKRQQQQPLSLILRIIVSK